VIIFRLVMLAINSRFVLKIFSFVNCVDTYSGLLAHVLTLQENLMFGNSSDWKL